MVCTEKWLRFADDIITLISGTAEGLQEMLSGLKRENLKEGKKS